MHGHYSEYSLRRTPLKSGHLHIYTHSLIIIGTNLVPGAHSQHFNVARVNVKKLGMGLGIKLLRSSCSTGFSPG